ncbi:MAG TPA: methyltransferase domain-containing protein [Puia sp.]|nr:methyltransferase domain-containing protein [Puia sp.]
MLSQLEALHPTTRFSNRVENYVKYRPSYPAQIVPFLEEHIGLGKDQRIADIGSGTGIFSELFLGKGYSVVGIEPNADMRMAADHHLSRFTGFSSMDQRAEDTGLDSQSIDLITVAQAFHWMDPGPTKMEFNRILKPGGHILLAWNLRLHHTPFLEGYETLKQRFGIDYKLTKRADEAVIQEFFSPGTIHIQNFSNVQWLDFDALKGQLLSASYIPLPGHPSYDNMISELVRLFVSFNENGLVKMEFETKLYMNS